MRTIQDLRQLQAYPLEMKVMLTKQRIREWVNYFGTDGVYVSFSGGKDSTVLLHIVREMYPDIPAVFCDTGLEYPEIRNFVKTFDNVTWLKPKMTFRKVIEKYGYPVISKQVSKRVYEYRNAQQKGKDITKTEAYKEFHGERFVVREGYDEPLKSYHNKEKWLFLIDSPFKISNRCCDIMKKKMFTTYKKKERRNPITGQMADESINRQKGWLLHGCNTFEAKKEISNPMSFWYENDVLQYIKENNIEICSVYGEIVESDELPGQISWDEYAGFDIGTKKLTTTGCKRTGCMFCGYGCYLDKPGEGRFEMMKETHPKQYEYIMKPWDEGGLGYKQVIDWLNEHGNLNIRY